MPQISANGLKLEYETFGHAEKPAILLIMGLGSQLVLWPDAFCKRLAAAGYYVVRFDNRDIGLSSKLDHLGKPHLMRTSIAYTLGLKVRAPYLLDDMALDAVGLLDALGIKNAHVVGASMGGMIAQLLAAKHGPRVRSLTSIMSSSGHRWLPGPTWPVRLRLVKRPTTFDRESLIAHGMKTWRMIGSPGFVEDEGVLRDKISRQLDRGVHPAGFVRQISAIMASGSRVPLLKRIKAPVLIIHGRQDPLVRVAAAHNLAKHLPDAKLEIIDGMGHDLPSALLPRIEQLILHHLKHAERDHARAAPGADRRRA